MDEVHFFKLLRGRRVPTTSDLKFEQTSVSVKVSQL